VLVLLALVLLDFWVTARVPLSAARGPEGGAATR
jgi:hypothetical protein